MALAARRRGGGGDPAFLAEAKRLGLEVSPVSGGDLEALINEVYGAPLDVVKLAAQAVRERP